MKKRVISVHNLTKGNLQAFNDGWNSRKRYACDLDYFLGINKLTSSKPVKFGKLISYSATECMRLCSQNQLSSWQTFRKQVDFCDKIPKEVETKFKLWDKADKTGIVAIPCRYSSNSFDQIRHHLRNIHSVNLSKLDIAPFPDSEVFTEEEDIKKPSLQAMLVTNTSQKTEPEKLPEKATDTEVEKFITQMKMYLTCLAAIGVDGSIPMHHHWTCDNLLSRGIGPKRRDRLNMGAGKYILRRPRATNWDEWVKILCILKTQESAGEILAYIGRINPELPVMGFSVEVSKRFEKVFPERIEVDSECDNGYPRTDWIDFSEVIMPLTAIWALNDKKKDEEIVINISEDITERLKNSSIDYLKGGDYTRLIPEN